MALDVHMLSILSLPMEKEHNYFTSAKIFHRKQYFRYKSYFLDVQYFSSAV